MRGNRTNEAETSKLDRRKAALLAKLREVTQSMRNHDDLIIESAADPLDSLQASTQRDLTVEVLNRNSNLLRAVKLALDQIESGEYGLCRECGNGIPERRLDAIPWAEHCIPCQEAREREHHGDPQSEWVEAA
jgi:DnaK suppressor protein